MVETACVDMAKHALSTFDFEAGCVKPLGQVYRLYKV